MFARRVKFERRLTSLAGYLAASFSRKRCRRRRRAGRLSRGHSTLRHSRKPLCEGENDISHDYRAVGLPSAADDASYASIFCSSVVDIGADALFPAS